MFRVGFCRDGKEDIVRKMVRDDVSKGSNVEAKCKKYIFTIDELKEVLESEERIILYGAGDYGKQIADFIISIGKQSKIASFWVTEKQSEHTYRGIEILNSGERNLTGSNDYLVIITVSWKYQLEIINILSKNGRRFQCITPDLKREIDRKKNRNLVTEQYVPYKGLDFLLAGFTKSGTTSLYRVLREAKDIYLSEKKESQFFNWCAKVENSEEKLIATYFNGIKNGQLVGMIEPTFSTRAEQIQGFFGEHIRILFLVRNPVNTVFSQFKMHSRDANAAKLKKAYQKSEGICSMVAFEEWFNSKKRHPLSDSYRYVEWIKKFLKYYPKEQIKIVVFEEMVKYPKKTVNDILQFVGSSSQYLCDDLPRANEGSFVMADIDGLDAAERYGLLQAEHKNYSLGLSDRSHDEVFSDLMEAEKQFNQAKKIYNLKLSKEMCKKMEMYYYDSVRELEGLLNKDLSKIWF